MAEIIPDSRVPRIESIPTDDTTRSNEWTTSGNRIKPEGSAAIKLLRLEQLQGTVKVHKKR